MGLCGLPPEPRRCYWVLRVDRERKAAPPMSDYLLNAAVTLFAALDPIALAPLFLVLTSGRSAEARRKIARSASLIAALVLVGFSILGEWLLQTLGISLPAFRIAGGLLLFAISFEMVFDFRGRRKSEAIGSAPVSEYENVAAFPLAVPLLAGPGAISATILISSEAADTGSLIALNAIIITLAAACFAVFLLADPIERVLKQTGRIVVTRLAGVMLAALSVQFVADGVKALWPAAGV